MQEDTTAAEAPATTDTMVAALLRERETLVARGLDERVAQVDEQLRLRDFNPRNAPKSTKAQPKQQTR